MGSCSARGCVVVHKYMYVLCAAEGRAARRRSLCRAASMSHFASWLGYWTCVGGGVVTARFPPNPGEMQEQDPPPFIPFMYILWNDTYIYIYILSRLSFLPACVHIYIHTYIHR